MANDNILKAVIDVSAPGAVQTFNQVAQASGKTEQALRKTDGAVKQANNAFLGLSRVVQDSPFGFVAIANNLTELPALFGNVSRAAKETGDTFAGSLLKSLKGSGGILLGLSLVTSALSFASNGLGAWTRALGISSKETDDAADTAKKYSDAIKGIFTEVAKEATQVGTLVAVLRSETETRERRLSAIKELQKIQPEIFSGLKLEGDAVIGLDAAYQAYIKNLSTVIAVKIKQQQLEQLITKQLELQGATLTKSVSDFINKLKEQNDLQTKNAKEEGEIQKARLNNFFVQKAQNKAATEQARLEGDIAQIIKDISELSKGVKLPGTKEEDKKKIKEVKKELEDLLSIVPKIKFDFTSGAGFENFSEPVIKISDRLQKEVDRLTKTNPILIRANMKIEPVVDNLGNASKKIAQDIKDGFQNAFSGIGEGLGEALAGDDIKNAFSGFVTAIGGAIKAIGEHLIELGVTAIAVKVALGDLFKNPFLSIAAGIALTAIGTAFQRLAGKGFAQGGFTGEGGVNQPAGIVHKGEYVIPAHAVGRLGIGFLDNLAFGRSRGIVPGVQGFQQGGFVSGVQSGGLSIQVIGTNIIRGQDIVTIFAATQRSQSRNF